MTEASGLLLRLAGPLQSWGEHSTFTERDTQPYPTRSGLTGLLAAALGRHRTDPIDDLRELSITVRVDRPGVRLTDFHTVGGGLPRSGTVPTAEGGRRGDKQSTIVSRRHYLADAAFTVAIEGTTALLAALADALTAPAWPPYLGRRSCPPVGPLLLAANLPSPAVLLRAAVPLARPRPRDGTDHVPVDFIEELRSGHPDADRATTELWDVPESFAPLARRHARRLIQVRTEQLPATLCAGRGVAQLTALADFLRTASEGRTA